MIANSETSIIEEVRSMKESNAAKHNFDVSQIIAAARRRQEVSGHLIIRQSEQGGPDQPVTASESKPEGKEKATSESEGCSQ